MPKGFFNFNPTLVRLKLSDEVSVEYSTSFQSYLSSIKTFVTLYFFQGDDDFNPTLVRLKQRLLCRKRKEKKNFNPTLVRLKHGLSKSRAIRRRGFQSYLSSIKTKMNYDDELRKLISILP